MAIEPRSGAEVCILLRISLGSPPTALPSNSNVTYAFGGLEGGGIYAHGANTLVTIDASTVMTNWAIIRGGGFLQHRRRRRGYGSEWLSSIGQPNLDDFTGGGAGAWVAGTASTLTVRTACFPETMLPPMAVAYTIRAAGFI